MGRAFPGNLRSPGVWLQPIRGIRLAYASLFLHEKSLKASVLLSRIPLDQHNQTFHYHPRPTHPPHFSWFSGFLFLATHFCSHFPTNLIKDQVLICFSCFDIVASAGFPHLVFAFRFHATKGFLLLQSTLGHCPIDKLPFPLGVGWALKSGNHIPLHLLCSRIIFYSQNTRRYFTCL